ncbi:MAG TPA: phenylalanine--tRNA ligase subunit alpha [Candidatus Saccharimonadales bacterium]|nr:phenylalanine--tRNA ligase subunit alpha [Candidatus Saccharimonadales bacterium]
MEYKQPEVSKAAKQLRAKLKTLEDKRTVLRAPEMSALYDRLKTLPVNKRAAFGKEVNQLKQELEELVKNAQLSTINYQLSTIDITAPFDTNVAPPDRPGLLPAEYGSKHPITSEIGAIIEIFSRMGFTAIESREIDDDYHMFTSLNFPPDHPARDEWDTFLTDEGLIAPAHTSIMQNRFLRAHKKDLENGRAIATIIPGRVFRNEDVDARHEHTFYQLEGIYVDEGINAGHLVATLKTFLETYYNKMLEVKINPFYFPFTEPSFEFMLSCPFCDKTGCQVCSYVGWIELLGCGMIHPNVLKEAGIDSTKYTGFAWGMGIDRLVMMKYGIEDVRNFHSGNLKFLRQFS